MGKLLGIDAGKRKIVKLAYPYAEPTRAIYYGVFFRDRNGGLQAVTGNFCAERKRAEAFIEQRKAEGTKTDYFIATLSVPVSALEAGNARPGSDAAFGEACVDAPGNR